MKIAKLPLSISGISLALAIVGNILLPYSILLRKICGILSGIVFLLFILRVIFNIEGAKKELESPIAFGILPTATMTLMLLCTYLPEVLQSFSKALWWVGVASHLLIMLTFIRKFVFTFDLKNVFPTWFVVTAGIIVASVTSPPMGFSVYGKIFFYIGLILYITVLPFVVYRLIKMPIAEAATPTMAIFAAPASLSIVGYSAIYSEPNKVFIGVLAAVAIISYIFALIKIIPCFKKQFFPTIAAFGFPFAISALAFRVANKILFQNSLILLNYIVKLTEILAILVVLYVIVRYLMFYLQASDPQQT